MLKGVCLNNSHGLNILPCVHVEQTEVEASGGCTDGIS